MSVEQPDGRPDVARGHAAAAFLRSVGWADAARAPLAGDASNRRYERLSHPRFGPAVFMDAPPAKGEDVRPFAALTGLLRAQGLSAPEIFAGDHDAGFLLLEDLGDALYARALEADPSLSQPLYAQAVDLLSALHAVATPETAAGPGVEMALSPYDDATLRREAALAVEWWRPGWRPGAAPTARADRSEAGEAELHAEFLDLISDACAPASAAPARLTLRDYHAENLIWLPNRAGPARVGLLDYQDALLGHPAYDLVSLLEDARRDVPADLAAAMRARYLDASAIDAEAFDAAYAALGAQRNLKIVGIFARLWLRDGKDRYLGHIPRVWAHLLQDLEHPRLDALRAWVARHLPEPTPERLARLRGAAPDASAAGEVGS